MPHFHSKQKMKNKIRYPVPARLTAGQIQGLQKAFENILALW
ncbi:Uncharacterized protein dnm_039090 [Desulfonema magnum]|uniref:Uncharacterized protein n=1 Tax=Desulfonema magnum TaxID=45655 RepID=A0A975GNK5_9BACT|nr:Uncharacterized protein dnm_039090 [Desulfonema magnum]